MSPSTIPDSPRCPTRCARRPRWSHSRAHSARTASNVGSGGSTWPPPSQGAFGLAELDAAVAALAQTATGEKFALLEGEDEGGQPVFVAVNQAAKRVDHVLFDQHVELEIEADDAREDAIIAQVGAAALFVAHETVGRTRWLHFYAPTESLPRFESLGVPARFAADPTWQTLSCFTDALRQ